MYKLYFFDEYEQITEEFIICVLWLLLENRHARALWYHRMLDRWNCVITYLMLQYGLREYFSITSCEFVFGRYGTPYLPEYPDVHFNISHCDAGCTVAVADCPVGVDIQDVRSFSWDIAKQMCCEQELAKLEQCINQDKLFVFARNERLDNRQNELIEYLGL